MGEVDLVADVADLNVVDMAVAVTIVVATTVVVTIVVAILLVGDIVVAIEAGEEVTRLTKLGTRNMPRGGLLPHFTRQYRIKQSREHVVLACDFLQMKKFWFCAQKLLDDGKKGDLGTLKSATDSF